MDLSIFVIYNETPFQVKDGLEAQVPFERKSPQPAKQPGL